MTISLAPPPLQIPPEFSSNKNIAAFFNGLMNTLYQLWTTVYGIRNTYRVETTDATVTALVRLPVATGKTLMIDATIVARRTGGSAGADGDSAFYKLYGAYRNVAGTLTGIGTPTLFGGEDQAAWNVAFSTSGSSAVVGVTGAANNNITWNGTISTYETGA
jgi:hypothetical protein